MRDTVWHYWLTLCGTLDVKLANSKQLNVAKHGNKSHLKRAIVELREKTRTLVELQDYKNYG